MVTLFMTSSVGQVLAVVIVIERRPVPAVLRLLRGRPGVLVLVYFGLLLSGGFVGLSVTGIALVVPVGIFLGHF
jgi:hypothetical protein